MEQSGTRALFFSLTLEDRKLSPLPQKVRLDPALRVVSITSGPLAHHSFLVMQRLAANGYPTSNGAGPRDLSPRMEGVAAEV